MDSSDKPDKDSSELKTSEVAEKTKVQLDTDVVEALFKLKDYKETYTDVVKRLLIQTGNWPKAEHQGVDVDGPKP